MDFRFRNAKKARGEFPKKLAKFTCSIMRPQQSRRNIMETITRLVVTTAVAATYLIATAKIEKKIAERKDQKRNQPAESKTDGVVYNVTTLPA